jgi:O-antigen/teichoic acid export membrane protein
MSFFGPTSPPAVDESLAPLIRRAAYHARLIGNLAIVQTIVQILGFLSGILIIRSLPQQEYAYFTIANTMQGTLNLLADIGVSVGVISIGGRVWQERYRFGQLVNTALGLRRKLAAIAILAVAPVLYFLLVKNGAAVTYTLILVSLVLVGLAPQLSIGVLSVVPRLRSDIGRIQVIDLTAAGVRLLGLLALLYLLNAGVAIAIAMMTFFLQWFMLRRYATGVVDLNAPSNPDDRRAITGFIRKLAPNAVFYCIQGQITVFLISIFAHRASSVAEVGALGRLAMIFAVLSNLLTNIFVPAFARAHKASKLRLLYWAIISGVGAFGSVVVCAAALFPDQFLFILGNKYTHLHQELLLMVSAAVLNAFAGAIWALNSSKAWISGSWLYIPATLATQIALIPFTDFSRVSSVLLFNLISVIPSLVLNFFLSYRGFRSLRHAAS